MTQRISDLGASMQADVAQPRARGDAVPEDGERLLSSWLLLSDLNPPAVAESTVCGSVFKSAY